MSRLRRLLYRLYNVLRPARGESELAREVASHLALLEDDFRRRGMSAEDARLAARRAFGGVEQAKEVQRDARSFPWLDDARRDLRHATRLLGRNPIFALTAALSLAIGIGATTTIFTVANALLLRAPAGVADPDRLADIYNVEEGEQIRRTHGAVSAVPRHSSTDGDRSTACMPIRRSVQPISLRVTGGAERIFSNIVTPNYFPCSACLRRLDGCSQRAREKGQTPESSF